MDRRTRPSADMTADELRARLKALGLRQLGFAEQLGVSRHTVKRWASGDLPVPKYAALVLSLMADRASPLQSP